MARVEGPLFSLRASGKIADAIVYSRWKGRPYVRRWLTPANPRSDAQRQVRGHLTFLTQWWANWLTAHSSVDDYWVELAARDQISPIDAFVKYNMRTQPLPSNPVLLPNQTPIDPSWAFDHLDGGAGKNTAYIPINTSADPDFGDAVVVEFGSNILQQSFFKINDIVVSLVNPPSIGETVTLVIKNLVPATYGYIIWGVSTTGAAIAMDGEQINVFG